MYHNTLVCGAFWGVWVKFKNFLGPTYVDNYLSFWKYSPIFLFLIQPHLGPLLHFLGPSGLFVLSFGAIFGVGVRFKTFLEPINVDYQFLF